MTCAYLYGQYFVEDHKKVIIRLRITAQERVVEKREFISDSRRWFVSVEKGEETWLCKIIYTEVHFEKINAPPVPLSQAAIFSEDLPSR